MHLADTLIIAAYMIILVGIGIRVAGRQKTTDSYFIAGRTVPVAVISGSATIRGVVTALSWFNRKIKAFPPSGLGDALACVPALEGLRDALPGARFGALCSPRNSTLFSPRLVEPIHVWEGPRSTAALEAGLRSAGYTDALVATEEPLGYRLARASGARRRAGFWHRLEKTFKSIWQFGQLTDAVYRPAAWVARPEHEVAALYRLAQALGARLPIPDDPAYLSRWLDVSTPDAEIGRDAFAFQIAAKLGRGGWGPEAIARVAAVTVERAPLRRCVFLAGPGRIEMRNAEVARAG